MTSKAQIFFPCQASNTFLTSLIITHVTNTNKPAQDKWSRIVQLISVLRVNGVQVCHLAGIHKDHSIISPPQNFFKECNSSQKTSVFCNNIAAFLPNNCCLCCCICDSHHRLLFMLVCNSLCCLSINLIVPLSF